MLGSGVFVIKALTRYESLWSLYNLTQPTNGNDMNMVEANFTLIDLIDLVGVPLLVGFICYYFLNNSCYASLSHISYVGC